MHVKLDEGMAERETFLRLPGIEEPSSSQHVKVKSKVTLLPAWSHRVEGGYNFTLYLNSELRRGGWLTPRSGRFTPGKETRYPLYRMLGGPHGRFGRVRKISPTPGLDFRTFQSVAKRYGDWAIAIRTYSRQKLVMNSAIPARIVWYVVNIKSKYICQETD